MGKVKTFNIDISPLSSSPRKIWVYLPNSYDKTKKKYDVLYMFDGHNLFFDESATYGKCWGIKDYLDKTGIDLVVVGQECNHEGEKRMDEYCPLPVRNANWLKEPIKPEGHITAEWFVNVLKPECEKRFRIYKDRKHVGIAGSSMGGLMSAYVIARYNNVFSKAACVSPAVYFCEKPLLDLVNSTGFKDTKIYLDYGSDEFNNKKRLAYGMDRLLTLNYAYTKKGCLTYPNILVEGTHSEASWETIFPTIIDFLYSF